MRHFRAGSRLIARLAMLACCFVGSLHAQTITNFAGNGTAGFSGDGGPATAASFNLIGGIARDTAGNVYISDGLNRRVRKVATDGTISTVAGNGTQTLGGDGGQATQTGLGFPYGLAVDAANNLYIADFGHHRVRKVSPAGIITTFAGSGIYGFSGDGGPATSALLNGPNGLAIDAAGNLYISEDGNHRIRKVTAAGVISTTIGNGEGGNSTGDEGPASLATFTYARGMTVDAAGVLFFADGFANRIRKITTDGIVHLVAGTNSGFSGDGGQAVLAQLSGPQGIGTLSDGTVFFVDIHNNRVRRISSGGLLSTFAGDGTIGNSGDGGPALLAKFNNPEALLLAADKIYVADPNNNRVRLITLPPPTAPWAPVIGEAIAGNTQATVAFSAPPESGGFPVTGYTVNSTPAGGVDSDAGTTKLIHLITGLANGTSYTFKASASNVIGTSVNSAASNAVTPAAVPGPPIVGTAVPGNAQATLSFSAPVDAGNGPVTGYIVTSSPAGGVDTHAGSSALSHTITGLQNRTAYTFSVRATNATGTGIASSPSNAVTPLNLPSAPLDVSAAIGAGANAANVSFSPPLNFGEGVSGYRVTSYPAGGVDASDGQFGLTHTVQGLVAGTSYTFTVQAVTLSGPGPHSAPSNAVTPFALPGAPTSVVATNGDAVATVTFVAPASDGGRPITGYAVTSSNPNMSDLDWGSTSLTHRVNVINGMSYSFQVSASNIGGAGALSAPSNTIIAGVPPDAPAKPTAVAGSAQATVSFATPNQHGILVSGYTVTSSPADGADSQAGSTALSHVVTGLTNGTPYTFTVVATNVVGNSAPSPASDPVTPMPPTVPGTPVMGAAITGNAMATVGFAAPASNGGSAITGYVVSSNPAGGTDIHAGTTGLTHQVTGLSNGTSYTFTVKASNAVGSSAASLASNTIVPSASITAGNISTIAGGWLGDGGAATVAALSTPNDVATDSSGNLYIADRGNHRIRKVTPAGVISTIAGTGITGFSRDGGQATSAMLSRPSDVVVDAGGNVYIADSGNNRIRKISAAGVITTIAGNGAADSAGDGGLAINAGLNSPQGVILDTLGNVYASEYLGHRIRKFSQGGVINTVAGTGVAAFAGDGGAAVSASLNRPTAMTFDASGNLFFADSFNNRVRKIVPGGNITTVAGNGVAACGSSNPVATNSPLVFPFGVAFDASGNLWVATACDMIEKVLSDGSIVVVAGGATWGFEGDGGPADLAGFSTPSGLAFDAAGNLYIADYNNERVRKIAPNLIVSTVAGSAYSGDGGPAIGAGLGQPTGIEYDAAGNVYFVDSAFHRVRKMTPTGVISTIAGTGISGFSGDAGPAINAKLNDPSDVAVDSLGNVFIADSQNNRIRYVNTDGIIRTVVGIGVADNTGDGGHPLSASIFIPLAIAFDGSGSLFIATSSKIRKVVLGAVITSVVGTVTGFSGDGSSALLARLNRPAGLAFDAAGNMLIADTGNHRIRKVANGIISTIAGNGTLGYGGDGGPALSASIASPRGVVADASGNIYFSDSGNHRVRKFTAGSVMSAVAGNGVSGYSGDGGNATDAGLALPYGIALDASGNLVIADYFNNRIRKVLTPQGLSPGAPVMGSATAGNAQATVSFLPPSSDGGSAISGYTVTSFPAGGNDSNAGTPGLAHVVTGLTNGTSYTFSVTASNSAGTSAASALSNAITPFAHSLSVNDVTVVEGNAGTKQANFTVSLSPASAGSVGFDIGTAPGTAAPGADYIETNLVGQTIPAEQTTANFSVTINGDTSVENNETFTVNLGNVTGATVVDGQGLGRIGNDDNAGLSITDVVVVEGNGEPRTARFVVTLSSPMPTPVTFDIGTSNGSASAGSDYVARNQVGKVLDAGRTQAVFEVSVSGDAAPEPDESFNVVIGNVNGALVGDGTAIGTIQNDDAALLPISSIQGSGVVSPLQGSLVSTSGVVTALTDSGFFIQSEVGQEDGDWTTSEAIFIASDDDGARVGNRVRVRGRVDEAQIGSDPNQLTLTRLLAIEVLRIDGGQALPAAVVIGAGEAGANLPVTGLERLEGMRVAVPEMRVVGPSGGAVDERTGTVRANGRFYGVAKGVARPFREPGMSVLDRARAQAGADLPLFDSNPERLLVNSLGQRGSVAVSADTGDTILGLVGVLAYGEGAYQVLPDSSASLAVRSGARPRAVAARGVQQATIGSFHLRRFLDDQTGSNEPVVDASAYAIRLAKAANAICAYARSPDVVAVSGIEGKAALAELADALNSRDGNLLFPESCTGDGGYRAVLHSTPGKTGSGFLVREAKVRTGLPRIEVESVSAAGNIEMFLNRDGTREPLHDVVPSLLQARINDATAAPVEITLLAVAITALEGDLSAQGAHGWLTQGQYLRAKRSAQAMSLARTIQARQRTRPQEKLVVLGNLESNEFSDGHADLLGVISGREALLRRELRTAVSPVNPPLTNLTLAVPRADRYTVSRGGNAEAVDHVLVSRALMQSAFKARIEIAHIDADFGEDNFGDAGVPVRVSDHDPVVLFLDLPSSP